eukprot:s485_g25.t1
MNRVLPAFLKIEASMEPMGSQSLEIGEHIAEPALWVSSWRHQGKFQALLDSRVLLVSAEDLFSVLQEHNDELVSAIVYARLFVHEHSALGKNARRLAIGAQLTSQKPQRPAALLAKLWQGELQRRSTLTLHQASTLLCSALQLHGDKGRGLHGDLWHLSHRAETLPAFELLNAHALCYGAEAPSEVRELCGHLAKVVIGGRPAVARLAETLLTLERLQVPLPRRLQQSAVQRLVVACGAAPRGLAAAAARLWCSGAEMEELFERMALALRVQLFWWRHGKLQEDARRFRERCIRELLNTQVDRWNRALWDVGVVQALQPHIDAELAQGLKSQEVLRSLQLLEHLALLRAVRPPMWRAFMSALFTSREKWPQEDCVETVWLLTSILRRTPFQALVPPDLVIHAAAHAGRTISHADPVETASMLFSLERLMNPVAFRQVLWQHQSLIRARLSDDTPAVLLGALARGGRSSSKMPPWWREEVLRPWGGHLRRLFRALRCFTGEQLTRAQYAKELLSFQLADLGLTWQAPLLRALGVTPASGSFARSAAREVLRQRRRSDTSSPWALRALGVLSWDLHGAGTAGLGAMAGRKLVFTGARNMKAETDADRLLSVDLGYVDSWIFRERASRFWNDWKVCFLTSGETLTVLDDELQGKKAKTVKKALAAKVGISRFKQRLFVEDGLREIQDDEVLDPVFLKVQLVVLEFWPPDDDETQKMISASCDNDLVALEHLLQQPRNPNEADTDGMTPLFHAAEQGHVQPMELLLEAGAKTDVPEFAQGRTPLWKATQNANLEVVRFLVDNGAAKDQADKNGKTPLWVAALNGHLDIMRFLVDNGAAKDQAANNGATPLSAAALKGHLHIGHLHIVRFLVDNGAAKDQAANNGATPLSAAALKGHLDIVRFLVDNGAAKDQAANDGLTPLWVATQNGYLDIVRFLVEHDAAKDQTDNNGSTPLWVAALKGHLHIVRFLVDNGAAKDQTANDGATPLWVAASNGHLNIVRFLVEHDAAKDQAANDGLTPLWVATHHGHLDIVRFLVDNGAAKDQAANSGKTPLWVAASIGHLDIVRFLVEVGAAKDQAANNGATPLSAAALKGHLDIARFLVDNGAAKDQAERFLVAAGVPHRLFWLW